MEFLLVDADKFDLDSILKQFEPFSECSTESDTCCVHFKERPKDFLKNKTRFKKVGDHSFYLFDNDIVVANATSFVLIRDNFTNMDVLLVRGRKHPIQQISFLLLQGYRYILANKGHFQMHSAVVIRNGVGIAFCGLPGAGKSTQAHLWEEHLNAEALNLDQPCVFFKENEVYVSGSPWSGKEDCYKNKMVPLKAIFYVEQAPENKAERLSLGETFSHLYLNNYLVPLNEEIDNKHKAAVMKVTMNVPVYRLKCTISKEAVETAYNMVFPEDKLRGIL